MKTWLELFPHWHDAILPHPTVGDVLGPRPRDEAELDFARAIDQAPKTEVHVHAEAAVPSAFYASRAAPGQGPLAAGPFADIRDFLWRWMANLSRLQRSSDYAALGRAFVADRASRRIVHTECHISPLDTSLYRARLMRDLPVLDLPESLRQFARGVREGVAAHPEVTVRAVVDLVHVAQPRDLDVAYAALSGFVDSADNQDAGGRRIVVAVGLGGPERPDRAEFFAEALARFRALGLKLDLHSGEQVHVTPDEHRRAVEILRPDRVGHGIRGAQAGYFTEGGLAACPLSNVLLRCHEGPLQTHPVAEMWRRGLSVSINTDDPLLLGTNLVLEYVALRRAFGWELDFFETTQAHARRQLLAP